MGDLISRSALLAEIDRERKRHIDSGNYAAEHLIVHSLRRLVEDAPAVEAEPVRRGVWKPDKYVRWCNLCDKWFDVAQGSEDMNYCPACGAKMKEEEK